LTDAGVYCQPDTFAVLEDAGVVTRIGNDEYELAGPARELVRRFILAKGPEVDVDVRVDYPEVFVVMPFGEPWSELVYGELFEPAITAAGFAASRGDFVVRVGELGVNVWRAITQAGLIVADVSVPNPNVYYELGLAEALGKDAFVFKQDGVQLPADIDGEHHYPYKLTDLAQARTVLEKALTDWAQQRSHQPWGVKKLEDDASPAPGDVRS
jgi:hypothetical protein